MYLTAMIKVLPTQSGRSLAATAALSPVGKRQQRHSPALPEQQRSKVHRAASAKCLQGALPLLVPIHRPTGQGGCIGHAPLQLPPAPVTASQAQLSGGQGSILPLFDMLLMKTGTADPVLT